ncbi:MAG TPA: HAD-IA family hydrolase [Atribacteraceae bacterium]|nr:HAD-IA family hydrolase [Atribacteraceae bacterium]
MRFRDLIWDFDGTLFDTYPAMSRALRYALQQLGHDCPQEEIANHLKITLQHAIESYAKRLAIRAEILRDAYDRLKNPLQMALAQPFPGAGKICAAVAGAGGRNFILTHKEKALTQILLENHRMVGLFTALVSGDDGFPRKPSPEGFLHLVARYGLTPRTTLTVGDRAIDIQAARAAGLPTCYIGTIAPEDLRVDFSVTNLTELAALLF